ncbi:MAG TPA: translational GTPase TypA, partial [Flexistipes sinusarabici]|nr:translational GTPase TypA [Flexistipes sinusarabici]
YPYYHLADGAILLVDASEGPLPQTRFVLQKAFAAGLKMMVVVNKIDRKDARVDEVLDEIYELFFDLDANDEQIEFPVVYAVGRDGIVKNEMNEPDGNMGILLDKIVDDMPGAEYESDEILQILVSDLGYSDYLGRLAIGKIFNGTINNNEQLVCIGAGGEIKPLKVSKLQAYEGLSLKEVNRAEMGDIVLISGADEIRIGDTISKKDAPKALKRIKVDEPTVSMKFSANTSPMAGKEGSIVQASKIYERLYKETLRNVAIRLEETDDKDAFLVKGRGEFQLAILIETMRREGFELSVGRPEVIVKKDANGKVLEPVEHLL